MKRWTMRILVSLVLGAITTVGVAWITLNREWAVYGDSPAVPQNVWRDPGTGLRWEVTHSRVGATAFITLGRGVYATSWDKPPISTQDLFHPLSTRLPNHIAFVQAPSQHFQIIIAGWPLPALYGCEGCTWDGQSNVTNYRFGMSTVNSGVIGEVKIVTSPILSGFAVNSLLFALIWLILGPISLHAILRYGVHPLLAARRHLREAVGHCGECDFNLQGINGDRCPECRTRIQRSKK